MTPVFELATRADDAAIRALLARNSVDGKVSLSYRREPDYFLGCGPMGTVVQVLVAREGDLIAGLACRAIRNLFINGREQPFGYLGQLRVDRAWRGRWMVQGGFRLLRELHEDGRASAYVTTIVEASPLASGLLVKKARRGMPRYRFLDRMETLAMTTRGVSQQCDGVRGSTAEELPRIVEFLREEGARRQFFPALSIDDFEGDLTRGLRAEDFVLAVDGDRLLAVCALWDQSSYKQTVVDHYSGLVGRVRPLYNAVAPLLGRPSLPPVGSALRTVWASFIAVHNDDAKALKALLRAALSIARSRGFDYVVAAFSEHDPNLAVARSFRHIPYRSAIYTVSWDDGADFHGRLDERPCYLDPATL